MRILDCVIDVAIKFKRIIALKQLEQFKYKLIIMLLGCAAILLTIYFVNSFVLRDPSDNAICVIGSIKGKCSSWLIVDFALEGMFSLTSIVIVVVVCCLINKHVSNSFASTDLVKYIYRISKKVKHRENLQTDFHRRVSVLHEVGEDTSLTHDSGYSNKMVDIIQINKQNTQVHKVKHAKTHVIKMLTLLALRFAGNQLFGEIDKLLALDDRDQSFALYFFTVIVHFLCLFLHSCDMFIYYFFNPTFSMELRKLF